MPRITIKALLAIAALSLLLSGTGCTLMQPFPMAARAGDTVSLGVGSADGMTAANTTVNFIPDANPSSPVNLTGNIRAVFNLYADKRSAVYDTNAGGFVPTLDQASGHEPWETVVVLDLPTNIPAGMGKMQVQTSASFPQGAYGLIPNVGVVPIPFQILPGQGSSNPFNYAYGVAPGFATGTSNLAVFQPEAHYEVRPPLDVNTFGDTYGAISYTFTHGMVRTPASRIMSANFISIITQDLHADTRSQLQCSWSANATQLTVNLVGAGTNGMTLAESRISIVPFKAQFTSQPVLTTVHYYDMNGIEVTGPTIDQFLISNN